MTALDPCKNTECRFRAACPLRPKEPAAYSSEGMPASSAPSAPASNFEVRQEPQGSIGLLYIKGRLDDSLSPILVDVEAAVESLDGLLVVMNSTGGDHHAAKGLRLTIHAAKRFVPVVAWVQTALSGAVLTCLAADATYAASDAQVGAFGGCCAACDGRQPIMLVNRQSPFKWDHRPRAPRTLLLDCECESIIQRVLDESFEQDLQLAGHYTGTDADDLRTVLNGRVLTAQQAFDAGLIASICSEDEAYTKLLNMNDNQTEANNGKEAVK
jgi:ClpP class serine protease